MSLDNRTWFQKGLKDGIPIALGYFAVSFTLGITAKNAGLTALQAMLASFTLNASAGEFAGFTLIAAGAGYLEICGKCQISADVLCSQPETFTGHSAVAAAFDRL